MDTKMELPKVKFLQKKFKLKSTCPLYYRGRGNGFGLPAEMMWRDQNSNERLSAKNPMTYFLESLFWRDHEYPKSTFSDKGELVYDPAAILRCLEKATFVFPVTAFKHACIRSMMMLDMKGTVARQSFFVGPLAYVVLNGIPEPRVIDSTQLVCFPKWTTELELVVDPHTVSLEMAKHVLELAGKEVGVGWGRPDVSSSHKFGCWQVV